MGLREQCTKAVLVAIGLISLLMGTIGLVVPLLPTVPLWLLSAGCFAKSSTRLHTWLVSHPRFGPVISQWQSNQGIPRKVKLRIIFTIWVSLGASMIVIGELWSLLLLSTIGIGVSLYVWSQREPLA